MQLQYGKLRIVTWWNKSFSDNIYMETIGCPQPQQSKCSQTMENRDMNYVAGFYPETGQTWTSPDTNFSSWVHFDRNSSRDFSYF